MWAVRRSARSALSRPSRSFSAAPATDTERKPLPSQAEVVVIGGGVIGASTAYHLSSIGCKDVVLVEQAVASAGTTWHAAGLLGQLRATRQETELSVYGHQLYANLEAMTGQATGYKQCGSLTVAQTPDRMIELKRRAGRARAFGIDAEIVGPAECGVLYPYLHTDDLQGGLWLPGDGSATSSDLCAALMKAAKMGGASVHERTRVEDIAMEDGAVSAVVTDRGTIQCSKVINCAGQWARNIGAMAGVSVPLHSAEHFYVVTKPFEHRVPQDLPVMRDLDSFVYYREWSGGLLMGGFEPQCKPCFQEGVPDDFEFALLEEDWDHFSVLMEPALERTPVLETAEVQMVNGPESFTPDNQYILGEAPECKNFFVAAGMNSSGIASAGGAGRLVAEWAHEGRPSTDVWDIDIRRFHKFQNSSKYLDTRTHETLGLHYAMGWPRREFESCRPLRRSPIFHLLSGKGAVWGNKFGWERVNYYNPQNNDYAPTFGRPGWHDDSAREHLGCRESSALFDITSFAKTIVRGKHAEAALQHICAGNLAVEDMSVVYTPMLNDQGGFESDVTVTRLGGDEFMVVSATAQATRDRAWMQQRIDSLGHDNVYLTDVTSGYTVLSLQGPDSREVLARATGQGVDDFSNHNFPFSTAQELFVGYAPVRAARISYVGELGWELYIPSEMAVSAYEALKEAGASLDAGYYAIESMRLEKGFRAWGHELTPDVTPLHAGLDFAVAYDTDFCGKDALLRQKDTGVLESRVASVVLQDPAVQLWGGEPILRGDDVVGFVSSAGYGHSIGAAVALGSVKNHVDGEHVPAKYINMGEYSVDVAGERCKASVSLKAPFDPKGLRVKV